MDVYFIHIISLLVWSIEGSDIVVVLQRSLCIPGAQRLFYKQLIELLDAEMKCSLTVVLTGASTESLEPSMRYCTTVYWCVVHLYSNNISSYIIVCRRSMFSIACSTEAKTKLVSTFPAIASSLESAFALNTILPSAVQSIELATAETALSSDSSMTRAGNLYSFEDEQEEEGGLTCTAAVQRALATTLPRGMTAAKYLLEHQQLRSRPTTSSSSADMGVVVLGKLCAEGDNFPDGRQLAAEVVRCIV